MVGTNKSMNNNEYGDNYMVSSIIIVWRAFERIQYNQDT